MVEDDKKREGANTVSWDDADGANAENTNQKQEQANQEQEKDNTTILGVASANPIEDIILQAQEGGVVVGAARLQQVIDASARSDEALFENLSQQSQMVDVSTDEGTVNVTVAEGANLKLDFDLKDVESLQLQGKNAVFILADGKEVVFEDFLTMASSALPPVFLTKDGQLVFSDTLLMALSQAAEFPSPDEVLDEVVAPEANGFNPNQRVEESLLGDYPSLGSFDDIPDENFQDSAPDVTTEEALNPNLADDEGLPVKPEKGTYLEAADNFPTMKGRKVFQTEEASIFEKDDSLDYFSPPDLNPADSLAQTSFSDGLYADGNLADRMLLPGLVPKPHIPDIGLPPDPVDIRVLDVLPDMPPVAPNPFVYAATVPAPTLSLVSPGAVQDDNIATPIVTGTNTFRLQASTVINPTTANLSGNNIIFGDYGMSIAEDPLVDVFGSSVLAALDVPEYVVNTDPDKLKFTANLQIDAQMWGFSTDDIDVTLYNVPSGLYPIIGNEAQFARSPATHDGSGNWTLSSMSHADLENLQIGNLAYDNQAFTIGISAIANEKMFYDQALFSNRLDIKVPAVSVQHNNDVIDAGDGEDLVFGEAGNDILTGGAGHDKLYGGMGNDTFNDGAGNDTFIGGLGNDVFNLGDGLNAAAGQDGQDVFVINASNNKKSSNYIDGGNHDDMIIVNYGNAEINDPAKRYEINLLVALINTTALPNNLKVDKDLKGNYIFPNIGI